MKLMIRKMTDQDLEPLCVLLSDPDVMRYPEALYTLGLVDYLCDKNGLPHFEQYDKFRGETMAKTIYAQELEGADFRSLQTVTRLLFFGFRRKQFQKVPGRQNLNL